MLTAAATVVEVALLCVGACALIHRRGGGRPLDALALGVPVSFGILSATYQAAFLLGIPGASLAVEAVLVWLSVRAIAAHPSCFAELWRGLRATVVCHPVLAVPFGLGCLFLTAEALLFPPFGRDPQSYHLARVLLFQQEGTLFPEIFSKYDLVVKTVGADILSHAFLRFYTDYSIGIFQLLGYFSVVASGLALARRYASPDVALLSGLVIASMPQLVYQAIVLKSNIFAATCASACLLLGHRLVERPRGDDVSLLLLVVAFGVSARPNFLAFAAVFAVCFGAVLWKRGRLAELRTAAIAGRRSLLALLVPIALLSQVWLFAHNHAVFGTWAGPPNFVAMHQNADGLRGALANVIRYGFQSVHLLEPVDELVEDITGVSASARLMGAYDSGFLPWFGDAAISPSFKRFHLDWAPGQRSEWFGPLAFLIVLPSLALSVLRGPPLLRATALSLFGYAAAFCVAVAWFPWNARMLSPVFAGAIPHVAWATTWLRVGSRTQWLIAALSLAVFFWACFNSHPTGEFNAPGFGRSAALPPESPQSYSLGLPDGARSLVIVDNGTPIYRFFLQNPRVHLNPVWPWLRRRMQPGFDLQRFANDPSNEFDMVVCTIVDEPVCAE